MIKKLSLYAVLGCMVLTLAGECRAIKLPKKIATPLEQTSAGSADLKAKAFQVIASYNAAKAIYDNAVLNAAFVLAPADKKGNVSANDIAGAEELITAAGKNKQITQQLASLSKEDKELLSNCAYNIALSNLKFGEIVKEGTPISKELLADPNFYFEEQSQSDSLQVRVRDYGQKIYESIQMVESSLNLKQLISLCQDLYQYQRVGIFGLLKAQTAAMNLQTDLLMTGKQVESYVSYFQQMDYILNADENDLIIILSYTGSYFEYENLRVLQKKLEAPKIWMITSVQENYPYFVDEVLTFQSLQDQGSHPYQLQFIASLIAQEYNYRYKI